MTGDADLEGANPRTVVCTRGHEHHVDDLDKMGMDHFCPECHARLASGEVYEAKYRSAGDYSE